MQVAEALASTNVVDMHTHLFMPSLKGLNLSGIDELLTYHYLEAELFRFSPISPEDYVVLSKTRKADLIWQTLFVENSPVSEAARGVVAVMKQYGLDTLEQAREFFRSREQEAHIEDVLRRSGVSQVVMTNDPLDPAEAPLWTDHLERHPSFLAALRLDRLMSDSSWSRKTLEFWCDRMQPVYLACSLPDTFTFPRPEFEDVVMPVCRERSIPLSLMIGVRRQVNPRLGAAGDSVGRADLSSLEYLCSRYESVRFLVSVLSRENQHQLVVLARKFANLMPFGCWWFLNNPSIVEEITAERLEMLGTSFIPQHSDARVLEQLIYKWRNTRRTLAPVLTDRYKLLVEDGGTVTQQQVRRDCHKLFVENFQLLTPEARKPPSTTMH